MCNNLPETKKCVYIYILNKIFSFFSERPSNVQNGPVLIFNMRFSLHYRLQLRSTFDGSALLAQTTPREARLRERLPQLPAGPAPAPQRAPAPPSRSPPPGLRRHPAEARVGRTEPRPVCAGSATAAVHVVAPDN